MTETLDQLLNGIRSGDRATLGRAITLIESTRVADRGLAIDLIEACADPDRRTLRIGITGIPGVGKSTFIDPLGMALIDQGHRVAVLAVDPSSERSGGSILGDKTRMERLSQHPNAFIRPSATGGVLGGVAQRTREAIVLCEAAGYDRVLIETVGTGQNELMVDRMTDLNVLLMMAGAGDELQGIKRGIMESADLVAVNKADGEGLAHAEHAANDLRHAIALLPRRDSGRSAEVLLTSGLSGQGIPALIEHLERIEQEDRASGRLERRRNTQLTLWMHQAAREAVLERLQTDPNVLRASNELERSVSKGSISPLKAAERIADLFRTGDAPLP